MQRKSRKKTDDVELQPMIHRPPDSPEKTRRKPSRKQPRVESVADLDEESSSDDRSDLEDGNDERVTLEVVPAPLSRSDLESEPASSNKSGSDRRSRVFSCLFCCCIATQSCLCPRICRQDWRKEMAVSMKTWLIQLALLLLAIVACAFVGFASFIQGPFVTSLKAENYVTEMVSYVRDTVTNAPGTVDGTTEISLAQRAQIETAIRISNSLWITAKVFIVLAAAAALFNFFRFLNFRTDRPMSIWFSFLTLGVGITAMVLVLTVPTDSTASNFGLTLSPNSTANGTTADHRPGVPASEPAPLKSGPFDEDEDGDPEPRPIAAAPTAVAGPTPAVVDTAGAPDSTPLSGPVAGGFKTGVQAIDSALASTRGTFAAIYGALSYYLGALGVSIAFTIMTNINILM